MATTQEVLDQIAATSASLDDIAADIAALQALVVAGGTPQEVADAVAVLAAKAAGISAAQ